MKKCSTRIISTVLAIIMVVMSLDVNVFATEVADSSDYLETVNDDGTDSPGGWDELEQQLHDIENNAAEDNWVEDNSSELDSEDALDKLNADYEANNEISKSSSYTQHDILTENCWEYYIDDNNYAHITGYTDNDSSAITVPIKLGTSYAVSIEDGAFYNNKNLTYISIPFYVSYISPNTFDSSNITISSYWGSYAQVYSRAYNCNFENKSEYDFVDGVIDFSEIDRSSYSFITSNEIELNKLEASFLQTGSVFYLPPSEFLPSGDGYKVISIEENGDKCVINCERALGNEILNSIVFKEENAVPDWNNAIYYYDLNDDGIDEEYTLNDMEKVGDEYHLGDGEEIIREDAMGMSFALSNIGAKFNQSFSYENISMSVSVDAKLSTDVDIDITEGKVNKCNIDFSNNVSFTISDTFVSGGNNNTVGGAKDVSRFFKHQLAKVPIQTTGLETVYLIISVGGSYSGTLSLSYNISQVYGWQYNNGSMVPYSNVTGNGSVDLALTGKAYVEAELLISALCVLNTSASIQLGAKFSASGGISAGTGETTSVKLKIKGSLYLDLTGRFYIQGPFDNLINVSKTISWEKELFSGTYVPAGCFTVKFVNTRASAIPNQVVDSGSFVTRPIVNPVDGYAVSGWYKDAKCSKEWDFLGDTVQGDLVLYAKWEKAKKITYIFPASTKLPSKTVLAASGSRLDMPAIPKVMNYMYIDCYKDSEYKTPWSFINDKVPDYDIKLYVKMAYKKGYDPWKYQTDASGEGSGTGSGQGTSSAYKLSYEATTNGYKVSKCTINRGYTDVNVVIPSSYNGKSVTAIGDYAFYATRGISSVSIPSSVTVIEDDAFLVSDIAGTINLPNVTSIGNSAFDGCSKLTKVIIGGKNVTIDNYGFEDCSSLEEIEINGSVSSIGYDCFRDCTSLKKIEFPAGLKSVDSTPFWGCTQLEEVAFPSDCSATFGCLFYECNKLRKLTMPYMRRKSSVGINETGTLSGLFDDDEISPALQEITINGIGITKISAAAFRGEASFSYPVNVRKITVPSTVTSIGLQAFYGCSNLTQLTNIENVTTIDDGAFSGTGFTSFKIPNGVTEINGFSYTPKLTQIEIPAGASEIKKGAFRNSGLCSVSIPNSVTAIREEAFYDCNNLTDIYIPDSVTVIGMHAFAYEDNLKSIRFPKNGNLWGGALEGCYNIEKIEMPAEPIYNSSSYQPTSLVNLYSFLHPLFGVFYRETTSYGQTNNNKRQTELPSLYPNLKEIVFNNGTNIYKGLNGWNSIERITLSDQMTVLTGLSGTDWISNLDMIEYANVHEIGASAFSNCSNIKVLNIPDNITTIKNEAFSNCSELTTVTINDNLTNMEEDIFYNCDKLSKVIIKDGVKFIPKGMFRNCDGLISVEIPSSVERIEENAFMDCRNLKNVSMANGLQYIGPKAFANCNSLTSIVIPDSVNTIEATAFCECYSMEEFTAPAFDGYNEDGDCGMIAYPFLESISSYSHTPYFKYPDNLKKVTLTCATTLNGNASLPPFWNTTQTIKEIYLPNVTNVIGDPFADFTDERNLTVYGHGNAFSKLLSQDKFKFVDLDNLTQVSFFSDNESVYISFEKPGTYISEPSLPQKDGYIFEGWYTNTDYSEKWDFDFDMIPNTDKLSLYAKWTKDDDGIRDYIYKVEDNNVILEKYIGDETRISIPSAIEGLPVSKIKSGTFANNSDIYSIFIPSTIKTIEDGAFSDTRGLTKFTVSDANNAFCVDEDVLFSKDKSQLICYPIRKNQDTYIIPDSVLKISSNAFKGSKLNELKLNNNLQSIGSNAFYDCKELNEIILPDSVRFIGVGALEGTEAKIYGPLNNNVINDYVNKYAINYNQYKLQLTAGNNLLLNLDVTAGICLNSSYTSVIDKLEYNNKRIKLWVVDGTDNYFDIHSDIMPARDLVLNAVELSDVSYIIQDNHIVITGIGNGNGIDPVIPSVIDGLPVTSIASEAFTSNTIKSVTIPSSVMDIASNAFNNSLTIICDKESTAYNYAVNNNLSVETRKYKVSFNTCGGNKLPDYFVAMGDIIMLPSATRSNSIFNGWFIDETFTDEWHTEDSMPDHDITLYADWKIIDEENTNNIIYSEANGTLSVIGYEGNGNYINIPSNIDGIPVTSIADRAFMNNKNIRIVSIPNSIVSIGSKAFLGCKSLETIEGGSEVTTLGEYAFAGCSILSDLNLGNMTKLTKLPERCFMYDSSLLNITLPSGIEEIGSYAFSGCTYLNEVILPDGITSIGSYVFYGDEYLESINLPSSLNNIDSAFADGCPRLKSITVASKNTAYKSVNGILYSKAGNELLRCPEGLSGELTINKSVQTIGSGAFNNCANISSLRFTDGLVSIDDNAFSHCYGLAEITLPNTLTKLGDKAFAYCSNLKSITVNKKLNSLGSHIFDGDYLLTVKGYENTVMEEYSINNNVKFDYIITANASKSAAPALKSVNNTTVTLNVTDGCEYKVNNGEWQKSSTFTDLKPLTKYYFYQRISANKGTGAGATSPALTVTTGKASGKKIKNVIFISVTMDSITVAPIDGSEYSLDGINWQTNNTFNELQPDTEYTVFQRMAQTKVSDTGEAAFNTISTGNDGIPVTFNANGGFFVDNGMNTKTEYIQKGNRIVMVNPPRKAGYTLSGWTSNDIDYDFSTEITEPLELVACWTPYTYEKCSSPYIPNSEYGIYVDYNSYIELKCDTSDATIYYTIDGSTPVPEANGTIKYNEAIQTNSICEMNRFENIHSVMISAIAICDGYADSNKYSNTVCINMNDLAYTPGTPDEYIKDGLNLSYYYENDYYDYVSDVFFDEETGNPYVYYTGSKIIPNVTGYYNGKLLTKNVDYTVSYSNNINAGQMSIKLTGKGNYKGITYTEKIDIRPLDISSDEFRADNILVEYNGKAQKPTVVLYYNDKKLAKAKDYTFTWKNEKQQQDIGCTNSGIYNVVISGKGNYTGTRIIDFKITPKHSLAKATISKITTQPWTGEELRPEPIVKLNSKPLILNEDYELEYSNNVSSGKATITVKGIGNYYGEKQINFTIKGTPLSKATIENFESKIDFEAESRYEGYYYYVYPNEQKNVKLYFYTESLKDKSQDEIDVIKESSELTENVDYKVTYSDLSKLGKVTVTYSGIGRFEGKISKTYNLIGKDIKKCLVSGIDESYDYTGSEIIPYYISLYTVDEEGYYNYLNSSYQYTVSYKNNIKPGTATITIKGCGDYSGTITKKFKINPIDISTTSYFNVFPTERSYYGPQEFEAVYSKGGTIPPTVYAQLQYTNLVENKDYSVSCEKITKADESPDAYTFTIKGKGAFKGSKTINFAVKKRDINDISIKCSDLKFGSKKGNFIKPVLTDTTGKKSAKLIEGVDYEILDFTYEKELVVNQLINGNTLSFVRRRGEKVQPNDIIPVGAGITISIRGINNYSGDTTYTYKVYNEDISKATVKVTNQKFNGCYVMPKKTDIKVIINKKELTSSDYEIVSCSNNYNKGTATMIIRGKGEFSGEKKVTFKIV